MPSVRQPIPQGFVPLRLYSVTVHSTWTKFFVVPEYEIGVLKAGWRGARVDVQPTSDVVHVSENAETVFQSLVAKYGEPTVRLYHAGPQRLDEDMRRQSAETREFMSKVIANEDEEERKRIAADRDARKGAAVAEAAAARANESGQKAKKD